MQLDESWIVGRRIRFCVRMTQGGHIVHGGALALVQKWLSHRPALPNYQTQATVEYPDRMAARLSFANRCGVRQPGSPYREGGD
jgi:hypothetical protein